MDTPKSITQLSQGINRKEQIKSQLAGHHRHPLDTFLALCLPYHFQPFLFSYEPFLLSYKPFLLSYEPFLLSYKPFLLSQNSFCFLSKTPSLLSQLMFLQTVLSVRSPQSHSWGSTTTSSGVKANQLRGFYQKFLKKLYCKNSILYYKVLLGVSNENGGSKLALEFT